MNEHDYDADPTAPEYGTEGVSDSAADRLVNELMPDGVDWQRLVASYPRAAMAMAFAGGLFLGRRHGTAVLAAASGFVANEVARNVNSFVSDFSK
ncbi:MAG: hypothetical protein AAGN66_22045 [Acidobacteriota bacterium]